MKPISIFLLGFIALASEGFKIPKSYRIAAKTQESTTPPTTLSVTGQSSTFQTCVGFFISGSQDSPTPMCRVWALELLKNISNVGEERLENLEDQQKYRYTQEIKVSYTEKFNFSI